MVFRRARKYLLKALIGLAVLVIIGMILLAATNTHEEVASLAEATQDLNNVMRLFRWTVLVLIIAFWEKIVELYAPVKGLSEKQIAYAKSLQWRVAAILVVFDLLVIEAIPARLLG